MQKTFTLLVTINHTDGTESNKEWGPLTQEQVHERIDHVLAKPNTTSYVFTIA